MGFFERLPYTDKHGLNEDWLIDTVKKDEAAVKQMQEDVEALDGRVTEVESKVNAIPALVGRVAAVEGRVTTAEGDITDLKAADVALDGRLTTVEGYAGDISDLSGRIEEVNTQSISRDNNLGNRVTLLEEATIHPIDIYNSSDNYILSGDYLVGLPVPYGRTVPFPAVEGHNNNWSYDEKGFYNTGSWQWLMFDTQYAIPTSGGGSYLEYPVTVTAVFCSKSSIDASIYNIADDEHWITETHTFTAADTEYLTENLTGYGIQIRSDGNVQIRSMSAGSIEDTYRLIAVKAEKGENSTLVTLNTRDKKLMDFASKFGGQGGTPIHYYDSYELSIDSITTDPAITWADGPYFTVEVDLYKVGSLVQGSLKFILGDGQEEAITMTDLVTSPKNIDVSALGLPAAKTPGAAIGSYCDILNREQYLVYGSNTGSTMTAMNVFPYFVSKTTAADGTVVEIPIAYVC